jgi:hypothetical protein
MMSLIAMLLLLLLWTVGAWLSAEHDRRYWKRCAERYRGMWDEATWKNGHTTGNGTRKRASA